MELHEIRYFLALSKTLNFTKAAEMCNVSQPALTRAIQKMEDELGGLLFSRERNNTHLTELGRMLEPHLTEVLTRTQAAKETASRFLRRKRLVSPAFSDADGCAELSTLKRSVRSSLRRC